MAEQDRIDVFKKLVEKLVDAGHVDLLNWPDEDLELCKNEVSSTIKDFFSDYIIIDKNTWDNLTIR